MPVHVWGGARAVDKIDFITYSVPGIFDKTKHRAKSCVDPNEIARSLGLKTKKKASSAKQKRARKRAEGNLRVVDLYEVDNLSGNKLGRTVKLGVDKILGKRLYKLEHAAYMRDGDSAHHLERGMLGFLAGPLRVRLSNLTKTGARRILNFGFDDPDGPVSDGSDSDGSDSDDSLSDDDFTDDDSYDDLALWGGSPLCSYA